MEKEKSHIHWILGISIILLGASLFLNISNTIITNDSIVLTFVGILATFIVVGNYAQVTEIRNSTNSQIKDLETYTQSEIQKLEKLQAEISKATKKLEENEKRTNYVAGEAYRLYGNITREKGMFRLSTAHYISALHSYCLSEDIPNHIKDTLDFILKNLQQENWNKTGQPMDFNYDSKISAFKILSDTYDEKQKIIELLEKYHKK